MRLSILLSIVLLLVITGCADTSLTGKATDDTGTGLKIVAPIQTCKMIDVPYDEQEAYTDQEPYQAIEEYQVSLKYDVPNAKMTETLNGFDVWAVGEVYVRNVDTETGVFTVVQTFKTLDGSRTYQSTQYVMSGETKLFRQEHDVDANEDWSMSYVVTPGEKTMTRTVTKYRPVTKYRTVTKYRQEERCD